MKTFRLCLFILLIPVLTQASEISIFAASSLTESLQEVAAIYRDKNPDQSILLHFAGSQALATQIEQDAPADLFIAANSEAMKRLQRNNLVEEPSLLLHNRLILASAADLNPQLSSINDLARPGLLLVIGNPQVPIGRYTQEMFKNFERDAHYGSELVANIRKNIISEENMVKAIVAKLLLGEVDAGIVYKSDLAAENTRHLVAVSLPEQHLPRVSYPAAILSNGNPDAREFLAFLQSDEAQKIFIRYGFLSGAER